MIVCPRCSKENQDHYKFCLGCGAELPRNASHQPKSFTAPTPPSGVPQQGGAGSALNRGFGGGSVADAATQLAPAVEPRRPAESQGPAAVARQSQAPLDLLTCPKCGASVPKNFKFCGSCGHPMAQAAAISAAPPPNAALAATAIAAPVTPPRGSLVLIRPDGSEGDSVPLSDTTSVGRQAGGVFAADLYLSPRHATFSFESNQLVVRDEDSLNGIYLRVDRDVPIELREGSIFRIGQELIRFNVIVPTPVGADGVETMGSPNPGYVGRLSLVIGRSTTGNSFPIPPQGLHLGRERGDLIFPEDGYVSGLHARIHGEHGRVFLTDVGSSNGTFIRVIGRQVIRSGDLILMGQQLFRAEY
ncbi:MAG: Basic proline-rich protein precursor [Myxococcaceae bacterium]|nr:Basic proline-rich protein precursor [Myxococcaceae bacterium]